MEPDESLLHRWNCNATNASTATTILIESGSCSGQMKRVRISR
jgi:hypothetical protein